MLLLKVLDYALQLEYMDWDAADSQTKLYLGYLLL